MFILERSTSGFNSFNTPAEVMGVVVDNIEGKENLLSHVREQVKTIEDHRSGPGMKVDVIGIEEVTHNDLRGKFPPTYEISVVYDDGSDFNRSRYIRNTFRLRHVKKI